MADSEPSSATSAAEDISRSEHEDELLMRMAGALLFATERPLEPGELARELDTGRESVDELLNRLNGLLSEAGLIVERIAGGYRLATAPDLAGFLRSALGEVREIALSDAAMEVLAIIAYHQPITRPEIDEFRRVNSSGVVRTLLEKSLIQTRGREESPGRPFLYVTTGKFLELFGLDSLEDLPQVEWVEPDDEAPEVDLFSLSEGKESGESGERDTDPPEE